MLRKIGRLFVIKTRFEACLIIYALALGAPSWIGAVTPFGGVLLVVGWMFAGVAFWCSASNK